MPKFENKTQLLPEDITAVFGAINLNDHNDIGRTSRSPIKITVHDTWNQNSTRYDGDIAILSFAEDEIPLTTFAQSVCICDDKNQVDFSTDYIGGWKQSLNGSEKVPMKIQLPGDLDKHCFANITNVLHNEGVFCVGRDDTKDICPSDGAGFFKKIGSRFYFRGIVSFGIKDQANCDVTKFAVVTETSQYERWIDVVMMKEESSDPKKIHCKVYDGKIMDFYKNRPRSLRTCVIYYQDIDDEGFTIANVADKEMKVIFIAYNKKVKFLPESMAELYSELMIYHVRKCSIRTVNEKHFKGLGKLEDLSLWHNEIELIARNSFKDLTNLKKLDLGHNKLKFIEPKLFQSLSKLRVLYLMENEIETLDEHIFDQMVNVEDIYMKNNKLSVIPQKLFKKNLKLTNIQLGNNKIQIISSTMFDRLINVTTINLQKNICVDNTYDLKDFTEMKNLLRSNCSSAV